MSQISIFPKVMAILSYWEASGEVSKLKYTSLLYFSSKRSYCSTNDEEVTLNILHARALVSGNLC